MTKHMLDSSADLGLFPIGCLLFVILMGDYGTLAHECD